jgi:hypothetical protein
MGEDVGTCRFLQSNRDRREIYAIVDRGGSPAAYGPLTYEQVDCRLLGAESRLGRGDAALAASLLGRGSELHDLDDFYRFYGYPPDVVDWVESTPLRGPEVGSTSWFQGGGRELDDVVRRLGLDRATLYRATHAEVADPGNLDAAGDPVFYPAFWDNWAIGDLSGRRSINPRSYRFKAWLSFHT